MTSSDINLDRVVAHLLTAAATTQDRANQAAVEKDETTAIVRDEIAELLRVIAAAIKAGRRG